MRRPLSLLGLLLPSASCSHATPKAPPPAPLVYVSNEDSGDVVAVDTGKLQVASTIHVGKRPRTVRLSPDKKTLYVTVSGSPRPSPTNRRDPAYSDAPLPPPERSADGVAVLDLAQGKLLRALAAGQDPTGLDVSPDGKTLYVSNEETAEMTVVDTASGTVKGKVADLCKVPQGVAVRPDGKLVYVACKDDNAVAVIDAGTLSVTGRVAVGKGPRSITFTKDGAFAFVTDEQDRAVTFIDTATLSASDTVKVNEDSPMPSGPRPAESVLSPDEKRLYVSCGRGGSVSIVDVAAHKQIQSIDGVGDRPWGMAISPDGARLYLANGPMSFDVSVVNLQTGNVDKRVYVGGTLWGLAMASP